MYVVLPLHTDNYEMCGMLFIPDSITDSDKADYLQSFKAAYKLLLVELFR